MYGVQTSQGLLEFEELPDKCPFCQKHINPIPVAGIVIDPNGSYDEAEVFFTCPNKKCLKGFIGYYVYSNGYIYTHKTSIGISYKRDFSEHIIAASPLFSNIYNEAYQAEQYTLLEVAGCGYRKSLEFLIKDYINHLYNSENKDKINSMSLSQCINKYISNEKIKVAASRASWLGNDETHYHRIWEDKNLTDLKRLIELTVHFIEMEEIAKSIEIQMPNSKKK